MYLKKVFKILKMYMEINNNNRRNLSSNVKRNPSSNSKISKQELLKYTNLLEKCRCKYFNCQ